jgi:hypothetical protein
MKRYITIIFIFFTTGNIAFSQCTINAYGQYGNLTPSCGSGSNGVWATSPTDCWNGEYSIVNVTAGSTYEFQTYRTSNSAGRYATVTTTANVPLVWGNTSTTTSITWTATFSGQVWFYTHLSNTCGTSTQTATRRVRCSTPVVSCTPPALAGFGNNVWNVECYDGNNFNTYRGFYTENNLNFNSTTRWGVTGTPSSANAASGAAYSGCPIPNDNHSFIYKRQGFPVGSYTINIDRDDDYILLINGVQVSAGGCCGWSNGVWTGTLNASSTIEARFREYGGDSRGVITFLTDPCNTTVVMTCGTTYTATLGTQGSWNSYTGCGWNEPGGEQVYSFTPTVTGVHTFNATTNSGDPDFFLMSSCGNTGTNVYGSCWGGGSINVNLVAGTTYYVIADNYSSTNSASFSLVVTCPAQPAWKSTWVSMNTGSAVWCAGETRSITVTVTNSGTSTWTNSGPDVNIGVKWNGEPDYLVRADANGLVNGATQTYTFIVTAPTTAGFNNLSFDVVNEGNFWFANNTNGGGPGNVVYTSAPITINALPVVSAGSGATVCPATSVQLNGSASAPQTVTIGTVTGNDLIYPFNTLWHDARTQCIILASELTAEGLSAGNITSVGFNVNFVTASVMNGFTIKMKNTNLSTLADWETGLSNVYSANYTVPGTGVQTINFQTPFSWDGTSNVVIEFCFDNSVWTNYSYIDYWNTGTNRMLFRAVDGDVGCNLTAPFVETIIPVFRFSGNGNTQVSWTSSPAGFTSTVVNPTVAPSVNTTYTITATNNGCSSSSSTTITVNNPTLAAPPANGDMVWRGASSNDWATLPNWWQYNGTSYAAASAAPTSLQNVIIPANQTCVVNQPNTNANTGSAKNLRIENGATLTMGSGSLTVAENWVNNGSFVPGTGTVTFAGSGTHTISGTTSTHNFNNLTMNKTGEVQLLGPIAMSGALTLTNGRLNIGNFNLDLPTNTINGGNANSYVRTTGTGVLMRNVGASMVNFPVGRAAYNPASLANSGTLDKFNVRVIDNVTDDGTAVGATTLMAVVNRTWMINEQVAGGSNVTLRLQWNGMPEEINNFAEISSFVAHFMAGEGLWDNIGGTVQSAGVIQTSGITSFSPFTVSSDNAFAPLPVELIAFTAQCHNEDVIVNWSTATEHNSQYFMLQVSEDGYSWSDLYVIEAAEFSTTVLEYSYIHKNAARTKNYYRLRQYDNDGTVETYNTIMSNCTSDENVFMTFPNPSTDAFTVLVNDKLLSGSNVLNISDASGKLIYSIAVDLENGSGSFALEGLDLPAGLYYLQLNNGSYASRIIKHSFR